MVAHPADGALHAWDDIADLGWDTLLLGNGLSINVSPDFAYDSLYGQAENGAPGEGLEERDRAIFERFDTANFEVVLAKLHDAIALAEVLDRDVRPYRSRFRTVQQALGRAVRSVHLERAEVPDSALALIKGELARYRTIISTSYDLILYWAIGYDEDYAEFCDCFWGPDNSFDPSDAKVRRGNRPVYYAHGALHLIVDGAGITRKLIRDSRTLLEQFGDPALSDREARPLLITEGSARDKLSAIEGNDYLAHVYETFKTKTGPLLVFGHALGEQDRHLINAINANPDRPVAISMRKKSKKRLREQQGDVWGKLDAEEVYFFDAGTHPLGSGELKKARRGSSVIS
jgi:hypothetical protein